jgi:hypothetical protein
LAGTDRGQLHAVLTTRVDSCWDRLEDAVSELAALHEVSEDAIIARVRAAFTPEAPLPDLDPSRIA